MRGINMKHYYALEQTHGNISIWSQYGRPTLHVFNNKKERDAFVREYEPCDLNHSIDVTTSAIAYKAYTKIRNGEKHFLKSVEFHN